MCVSVFVCVMASASNYRPSAIAHSRCHGQEDGLQASDVMMFTASSPD